MRNNETHEIILKPIKVIETKYNDVALIEVKFLKLPTTILKYSSHSHVFFVIYATDGKIHYSF